MESVDGPVRNPRTFFAEEDVDEGTSRWTTPRCMGVDVDDDDECAAQRQVAAVTSGCHVPRE